MRADRLISILMLLQTRGRLTAVDLAGRLGVSERTIYRDLEALQDAGIPVYTERGPGGGCELVEGYRTTLTGLTATEIQSLFVPGVPGPLADLGLGEVLEDALLKLLASLPAVRRHDAERARQRIMLDAAGWFQPHEPVPYLHLLQQAVWDDRRVRLRYRRSDGAHVERLIDAYGLVAKASIWYLVAHTQGSLRVYRVSRVQEAELCDSYFERPPDFDLAAYWEEWSRSFEQGLQRYPVTVEVASWAVGLLPRVLGEHLHEQISAATPDDRGAITLSLVFESPDAACGQVLGFGAGMRVIEPDELCTRVLGAAQAILALYAD